MKRNETNHYSVIRLIDINVNCQSNFMDEEKMIENHGRRENNFGCQNYCGLKTNNREEKNEYDDKVQCL